MCTATLHTEGIGYPDLDELIRKPSDLEFIIGMMPMFIINFNVLHHHKLVAIHCWTLIASSIFSCHL